MDWKAKLNGVFPPCVSVFNERQALDYDKVRENIEKYNQTQIRGFMPLGSNGEFRSLTEEESVKLVELYGKYKAEGKSILAGAGRESAFATIEFIKKIADKGADFVSVLPPHYYVKQMTDDVLIQYYTLLAEQSPLPILIYNIPKFAGGLVFSARLVSTLARHPGIAGLKDTSAEPIETYCDAVPEDADFHVLAGTIKKFYRGLAAGAIGGVLSIADYLPDLCSQIQELFRQGKRAEAAAKEEYANKISAATAGKFGVAGVKAAMDILGYRGGDPRIPLPPVSAEEKAEMTEVFQAEGLL